MTGTKIIELLKAVNPDSLWGTAIAKVVEIPDAPKVVELVIELRSQSRDNGPLMQEILGNELFTLLMAI